jgi:AT hook motif
MYQISPRDFRKLNKEISDEIEKVLLKFVSDGKIKVIPDEKPAVEREKRKRGRPRKIITKETKIAGKTKGKRGRPKKV